MRCPLQNKAFFGREWAFGKLDGYLEAAPGVPGVLVVGGPGSGKTALCAELLWPTQNKPAQVRLTSCLI